MVVGERLADGEPVSLGDGGEMLGHRLQRLLVDLRGETDGAQIFRHVENRRLRRAVGQRWNRRVDGFDAELDRFEIAERPQAVVAMGVKLHRGCAGIPDDHGDQRARALGCQQTADVLEANAVGSDGSPASLAFCA